METFDDEIVAKSLDFLDRKAKDRRPFFLWHCSASFREFPVRQPGLSAQMGKTIEDIQSQILKIKKSQ
jgi:arylsulfatase